MALPIESAQLYKKDNFSIDSRRLIVTGCLEIINASIRW